MLEGATATQVNLDVGTSLLDGDTDFDLPGDTLTVNTTAVSAPSFAASFTLNADGTFSYTHVPDGRISWRMYLALVDRFMTQDESIP